MPSTSNRVRGIPLPPTPKDLSDFFGGPWYNITRAAFRADTRVADYEHGSLVYLFDMEEHYEGEVIFDENGFGVRHGHLVQLLSLEDILHVEPTATWVVPNEWQQDVLLMILDAFDHVRAAKVRAQAIARGTLRPHVVRESTLSFDLALEEHRRALESHEQ